MKICLVGSILRHTVESDAGTYSGWGGMTESAIAPFAALLDGGSTVYFVGSVGAEDLEEVREFYKQNYPFVDTRGIRVNPAGTDHHHGTKHFVKRKIQVEPTTFEHIKPFIQDVDVVIFNFGNIDDIDPEAIKQVKENSNALVYVDVHRKPFGADEQGYMFVRGWQGWENYLRYADVVQMDKNECEALFNKKIQTLYDSALCAKAILDAGAKTALMTLGEKGIVLAYKDKDNKYAFAHIPAAPCEVKDTTGCGDAMAAGYLVALHEGASPIDAAKKGALMGAINCEFVGYIKGLDRQTIEQRMPADFAHTYLDLESDIPRSILV